jgi:streptomycin 6-kinase
MAALAERWELVVDDAVGRGNTSLVVRCRRSDGRPAILKLTPDARLPAAEASALRRWECSRRVPLVWGHDAALGALLLEAIPSETPLSMSRAAVGLDEVAKLIGDLHRSGAPVLADGVVSLAERVESIFEHWVERHGRRGELVTRAVPVERLRRSRARPRACRRSQRVGAAARGPSSGQRARRRRGARPGCHRPRPCVGDAAFDSVDWVFWALDDPRAWEPRSGELAAALGVDHERLWTWCGALAALLAAGKAARGADTDQIAALLALAP